MRHINFLPIFSLLAALAAQAAEDSAPGTAVDKPFDPVKIDTQFIYEIPGKVNVDSIAPWVDDEGSTKVFITDKRGDKVYRFNIDGGEPESEFRFPSVNGVIVFEDEIYLSQIGGDHEIAVFDAKDLEEQRRFSGGDTFRGRKNEHDLDICSAENAGGLNVAISTDDTGVFFAYDANDGRLLYQQQTGIAGGMEEVELIEHNGGCTLIIANENLSPNYAFDVWHASATEARFVTKQGPGLYNDDAEGLQAVIAADGSGYLVAVEQISESTKFHVFRFDTSGTDFSYQGYFELSDINQTDGISGFQWAIDDNPDGMLLVIDDDTRGAAVGWHEIFEATGLSLGQ